MQHQFATSPPFVSVLPAVLSCKNLMCARRRTTETYRNLLWLLVVVGLVSAAESKCAFRGKCGVNEDLEKGIPCVYTGEPQSMDDAGLELMQKLCPHLVQGPESKFCCDGDQIHDMAVDLEQAVSLGMGKCPTCYMNFVRIFCGFCEPDHDRFISINRSEPSDLRPGESTALEVDYALSEEFADGAFNSCAHVASVLPDTTVMQLMCGSKGAECTARDWIQFLGFSEEDGGYSPMRFNYLISEKQVVRGKKTLIPYNPSYHKCSDPYGPSRQRCSCGDCPEVCLPQVPPVLPPLPQKFTIYGYDGMWCLAGALFAALSILILVAFFWKSHKRRTSFRVQVNGMCNGDGYVPTAPNSPKQGQDSVAARGGGEETHVRTLASFGLMMENLLRSSFHSWGLFVAHYPLHVISAALVVSAILSSGLLKFTVTTNPVDLWVSHSSLARKHMNYFNSHFG